MARIKWDQPYGIICGNAGVPGAKYDQGGVLFNAKGDALTEKKGAEQLTRERVAAMRDSGMTDSEIADAYSVTRQKVTALCR